MDQQLVALLQAWKILDDAQFEVWKQSGDQSTEWNTSLRAMWHVRDQCSRSTSRSTSQAARENLQWAIANKIN